MLLPMHNESIVKIEIAGNKSTEAGDAGSG